MIDLFAYSDKEIKKIISSIYVICDTREKENQHILDVFDKMNIKHVKRGLPYGDYTIGVPKNEELSIPRDLDFSSQIVVERKASLDELAGNMTKERERIKKEFTLAPPEKVLLIEGASYSDMLNGRYRSEYAPKSYWATLHSFWHEYNIPFVFMPNPAESAYFIRGYFQYWLRNFLK